MGASLFSASRDDGDPRRLCVSRSDVRGWDWTVLFDGVSAAANGRPPQDTIDHPAVCGALQRLVRTMEAFCDTPGRSGVFNLLVFERRGTHPVGPASEAALQAPPLCVAGSQRSIYFTPITLQEGLEILSRVFISPMDQLHRRDALNEFLSVFGGAEQLHRFVTQFDVEGISAGIGADTTIAFQWSARPQWVFLFHYNGS